MTQIELGFDMVSDIVSKVLRKDIALLKISIKKLKKQKKLQDYQKEDLKYDEEMLPALEKVLSFYDGGDAAYDVFDLSHVLDNVTTVQKLAVVQWAMKHIVDHAREGGSYRYLIYDRLGFGPEAYAPLCADGMTISNEFDLNYKSMVQDLIKKVVQDTEGDLDFVKSKVETIKKRLGFCDEPGCVENVSCGWPQKDLLGTVYRSTCGKHYVHGSNNT